MHISLNLFKTRVHTKEMAIFFWEGYKVVVSHNQIARLIFHIIVTQVYFQTSFASPVILTLNSLGCCFLKPYMLFDVKFIFQDVSMILSAIMYIFKMHKKECFKIKVY